MNYAFQTFGCRLNRAEALDQQAAVIAAGDHVVPLGQDANVIVVRGCSVTGHAQRDCEKAIAQLKLKYPWAQVVVTGCMRKHGSDSPAVLAGPLATPPAANVVPTSTSRAYLKAQDGCNGRCSYCIVPSFRGEPRSEPYAKVMERANAFLAAGYHEIVLTGCNLSLYSDSGKNLADLLADLAELPSSGHRVRLGSMEPGSVANAVVDAMVAHPNICRFLHLPVQSGSDHILAAMRRTYVAEEVVDMVRRARNLMPDIAIGADIITGFPGESDAQFTETLDLVRRLGAVNLHIFPFSERPGTCAAEMAGQVPREVRHSRAHELSELGQKIREEFAATFKGRVVEVCVESALTGTAHHHHQHHHHHSENASHETAHAESSHHETGEYLHSLCAGWTGEYLSCGIVDRFVPRRRLVKVKVLSVSGDTLRGTMVD